MAGDKRPRGGNGKTTLEDPREEGPKPPFPQQQQPFPGVDEKMRPEPDHGEETYRGSGKLTGKVALITGGDSGIGKAVAIAFAREGADVLVSYVGDAEQKDADDTASWVKDAGRRAVLAPGDIGDAQHCARLVERGVRELGRVDIVVNNAAYQKEWDDVTKIPLDEFERTYRTNVFAAFYLTRAALPHMKPGGSVITTTSIQAYQPSPTLLPYASTKGALVTFTKSLALAIAKQGLRANAVAPGPVWTPLIAQSLDTRDFGKKSVFGRPAQPAELAPVYVFLASDDARYVTGMIYGVTGGELL